jgi:hypothetical protein
VRTGETCQTAPGRPTALRVSILVPLEAKAQCWGEGRSQMELLLIIVILILLFGGGFSLYRR